MSATPYYEEFYPEPGEFDEAIDGFKDTLRAAVKREVLDELETLRTKNRELADKITHLDQLERDARNARAEYERKMERASREAKAEVQKEGLRTLLATLAEPRYRLGIAHQQGPKCEKCDEDRNLHYTTPRGRESAERCECATTTSYLEPQETFVQEVTRRNREIVVWYEPVARRFADDNDYFTTAAVLKSPNGVNLDTLMAAPRDYGFTSRQDAQRVADAANAASTLEAGK